MTFRASEPHSAKILVSFLMTQLVTAVAFAGATLDASTLTKYVDPLPLPQVIQPTSIDANGVAYYEVEMKEAKQKLHRDLPETTIWGYEGLYPGPTIEAQVDHPIHVRWINHLPPKHILPVDKSVHGAEPDKPEVRAVTHLHGGHNLPDSDGHPDAWYTPDYAKIGPKFTRKEFVYPNDQLATALWYHDHAMGITRLNVYAGLAGFYILRDPREKTLNLPSGKHEIPLLLQDRSFNSDGSFYYPGEAMNGFKPSIVPEFFGDTAVVNGKIWPYLEVDPTLYRFRILNGSNGRTFYTKFVRYNEATKAYNPVGPGLEFKQIGTDGGLLAAPVIVKRLLLGPAERADVLIDFTGLEGQTFLLHNSAKVPFHNVDQDDDEIPLPELMIVRVKACSSGDCGGKGAKIPAALRPFEPIPEASATKSRDLTLSESEDRYGRKLPLLNNTMWSDPITELPRFNSTEIWSFVNLTDDTHAMHLHLVQYQILDRRPFDHEKYDETGKLSFTGPAMPPAPNEIGWKDTVQAFPGFVTRVIVRFDRLGDYVWHCHILEHEDYEMMRPFRVVE